MVGSEVGGLWLRGGSCFQVGGGVEFGLAGSLGSASATRFPSKDLRYIIFILFLKFLEYDYYALPELDYQSLLLLPFWFIVLKINPTQLCLK